MSATVRLWLACEAAVFAAASLVHAGALLSGYEHSQAQMAEAVIALVLVGGIAGTKIAPASSRAIGLAAQGFALLGTCVGLFMIAIGVGPRTGLDLILHAVMIALLVSGLVVVARRRMVVEH
jgi:hypothetical protein